MDSYSSFDLESPSGFFCISVGGPAVRRTLQTTPPGTGTAFSCESSGTCKLCITEGTATATWLANCGKIGVTWLGGCPNCEKIGVILMFGAKRD